MLVVIGDWGCRRLSVSSWPMQVRFSLIRLPDILIFLGMESRRKRRRKPWYLHRRTAPEGKTLG